MKNKKKILILVIALIISIISLGNLYIYLGSNEGKKYNNSSYIADNESKEKAIAKKKRLSRPTSAVIKNTSSNSIAVVIKNRNVMIDGVIKHISKYFGSVTLSMPAGSYTHMITSNYSYGICPANTNKCTAKLQVYLKDKTIRDKVAWSKNDSLTDLRGTSITVDVKNRKDTYSPCILGYTCPTQDDKTTTNETSTTKKSSSSGDHNHVHEVPMVTDETFSPGYYYAKGSQDSGSEIKCGDKIYISNSQRICYYYAAFNNNKIKPCDYLYFVSKINDTTLPTDDLFPNTLIKKENFTDKESETGCVQSIKRYIKGNTSYYTNTDLTEGKTDVKCGTEVTFNKAVETACNDKSCEAIYNGKTVYFAKDTVVTNKPTCEENNTNAACVTSDTKTDVTGTQIMKICGKEDTPEKRNNILTCKSDYKKEYVLKTDTCGTTFGENCYREYSYTCVYGKKPGVSASSGMLNANGLGTINLTGYDYGNVGLKGYYISAGTIPSEYSEWKALNSENKASETQPAGTYFIWVMNNKNVMSNSMLVKVYDADMSTTLKEVGIVDENSGDVLDVKKLDNNTTAYNNQIIDSKYVLLSNKLLANSTNTFDSLTTGYELETTSNKIAIYATLTSEDANYVQGYEPRTIDLEYGQNVAVIKIVNQNGKERSYTFIINRVDDRSNTNTLKSIKLSKGKIKFDPYVMNYEVEIPNNTKKVSINAELSEGVSAFIEGYEPRTIDITEDQQSAIIKVMSESGIVRSYVITFTKKSYTEDKNISAYLSSLTVPGTQLSFDRETYDYTITVPYETESIPVYAFAESESANVKISNTDGLLVGNNLVEIEVKNGKNTKVYSLHVIRKEYGLDISDSTRLGMLSIKGYDINFDPNVLDYTVKIKREKTLMIAATPESNRADIYMYGNNDLTGFSTVRVKVIAENGLTQVYSIDIKKDAYNKKLEIIIATVGCIAIISTGVIIILKRKNKKMKEYLEG